MIQILKLLSFSLFFLSLQLFAADENLPQKRVITTHYTYLDKEHSIKENAKKIATLYPLTWLVYPLTQPSTVHHRGSWRNWRDNFGNVVFDKDEPTWNWMVHPYTGSQLFLYYRSCGYSQIDALIMTSISSALFEFTVEIYTEPASLQDLYQTPILGSVLGAGIEMVSLSLLNSGNPLGKFFGHLLNPTTLLPSYEGKIKLVPMIGRHHESGATLMVEF